MIGKLIELPRVSLRRGVVTKKKPTIWLGYRRRAERRPGTLVARYLGELLRLCDY
jgi:hypothetical protein